MLYTHFSGFALERVPPGAKRVLDIGCGTGTLGREIKKKMPCEVLGITYSEEEAKLARIELDRVLVEDLNHFDVRQTGRFDCVICSHVLEHLNQPEVLLSRIHNILQPDGKLLVVLPNTLFWKQRLLFLRGQFKYTDQGILDRTHVRFYDWESANALLRDSGYIVSESFVDGMFPLRGLRGISPTLCRRIDQAMGVVLPGLFGFQFIFTCESSKAGAGPSFEALSSYNR